MGWRDALVWGRRGPGYTDQVIIDLWSIVHFISGTLLWKLGLDPYPAFLVLVAFEILENSSFGTAIFRALPDIVPMGKRIAIIRDQGHYVGDSWGNLIFDIIFGVAGYYAGDAIFTFFGWGGTLF